MAKFCIYIPTLMYCAPVWSPYLHADIQLLERVQHHYTKSISGLYNLDYDSRLRELATLSLQNRRLYAEMTTVYKSLYSLMRCPSSSLGLHLAVSNTRSNGKRLVQQRPISRVHCAFFCCRAPTHWNSLPSSIIDCASLTVFKKKLYAFLLDNQS